MAHYRKKEIQQAAELLDEANCFVTEAAELKPQIAMEILADCEDVAVVIGKYIETLGVACAPIVSILEDYCEDICRMNEEIVGLGQPKPSTEGDDFCVWQIKGLSERVTARLKELQNVLADQMPEDRKEVVFLPYKASMWDSLESVWKAADADKEIDAYVIPIPYYDRNPDGSFGELHYEGDQYPDDVPITHYSEYDLESRRPDVIYIHNPYDETNYVTSVEPFYYARNLRRYTDMLVYVPYFVLGEIEPDNQEVIDRMKHFCFSPGVIYAHKVIVQSENMRQIYINEYRKAAKKHGMSGEHTDCKLLKKKILGLGSPKMDKVLNMGKEALEIPAEWMKIIEKPDGSWKKIIFYNNSVTALLEKNEEMLRKIKSVLQIFEEHRDEIALLWRPHPLMENTLKSMRPQFWKKYRQIRDGYLRGGWGIYDDTADIDRAVVLSDAYYGDASSVVHMCQEAGKLIMIQNTEIMR